MKEFSTQFIAAKNSREGQRAWAHLMELTVNANSTAYFTSHPETITWNSQIYAPAPVKISAEDVGDDGSLPRLFVDVANVGGQAFKFAKDNDLSGNDVILRMVNVGLTNSGDDARIKMQITGAAFNDDAGRFNLALPFNHDAEGPRRKFDRATFKSIPFNIRHYAVIQGV